MKKLITTISTAAILLASLNTYASLEVGVQYNNFDSNSDNQVTIDDTKLTTGRYFKLDNQETWGVSVAYNINETFAIKGGYDDVILSTIKGKKGIDVWYGGLRATFLENMPVNLYTGVYYAFFDNTDLNINRGVKTELGVKIPLTESISVNASYQMTFAISDKDTVTHSQTIEYQNDFDVKGYSIGIAYEF